MYCSYKKPIRHLDVILDCSCSRGAVHTNENPSMSCHGELCIIEAGRLRIGSCFWKTTGAQLPSLGTNIGQLHLGQHQYQFNRGNSIRKAYGIIKTINYIKFCRLGDCIFELHFNLIFPPPLFVSLYALLLLTFLFFLMVWLMLMTPSSCRLNLIEFFKQRKLLE